MVDEGQPWHAPWKRICTTPWAETSTNSMSPPSAWTAGRIRLMTLWTRSRSGVVWVAEVMVTSAEDYRRGMDWGTGVGAGRVNPNSRTRWELLDQASGSSAFQEMQVLVAAEVIQAAVHSLELGDSRRVGGGEHVLELAGLAIGVVIDAGTAVAVQAGGARVGIGAEPGGGVIEDDEVFLADERLAE